MAKKEKVQKPLYKKWWFWVVAVSLVGAVGTGLFGGGTTDSDAPPPPAETQRPKPNKSRRPLLLKRPRPLLILRRKRKNLQPKPGRSLQRLATGK